MSVSAASLAKAAARFARTNLLPLSDEFQPLVLDNMVLVARKAKIAIDKLTDKQITACMHDVKVLVPTPEEIAEVSDDAEIPGLEGVTVGRVKTAFQVKHIQKQHIRNVRAAKAQAAPVVKEMKVVKQGAKQIHTSHEACSHASTKVARATCRRERKAAAAKA